MKHVRMTHSGRGPLHTYYYLEWMYDQMRHGDYGTSYGMWYTIANAYVQCWAREHSSGTTAIACIKEKRHFIGFELNKDYFDKAVRSIKAEQAQLTLF